MYEIDPMKIPLELQAAIPLAEKWGFPDEAERIALAEHSSNEELKSFLSIMKALDIRFLLDWVSRADGILTKEQETFMNLALAIDAVEMVLQERGIDVEF